MKYFTGFHSFTMPFKWVLLPPYLFAYWSSDNSRGEIELTIFKSLMIHSACSPRFCTSYCLQMLFGKQCTHRSIWKQWFMQTLGDKVGECIMGNLKIEHTENNNLTAIPHGELQKFYYPLMRRNWILITTLTLYLILNSRNFVCSLLLFSFSLWCRCWRRFFTWWWSLTLCGEI